MESRGQLKFVLLRLSGKRELDGYKKTTAVTFDYKELRRPCEIGASCSVPK
ncbi:hypothetical protein KIN20_027792 [Parelaphostrongylus tenuis]|uniref:Uncharacterized protein n=1 Tax=Parelaphostrongylus tenuis TaxID=148309 RepID=A0AAD5QZT9_PARTN|nr:hypothetical protein KIN20_027792 [Parelaphostrongylus tenuis]